MSDYLDLHKIVMRNCAAMTTDQRRNLENELRRAGFTRTPPRRMECNQPMPLFETKDSEKIKRLNAEIAALETICDEQTANIKRANELRYAAERERDQLRAQLAQQKQELENRGLNLCSAIDGTIQSQESKND